MGAGLSGLTCAYLLSKKGYKVTLLEADERCGGLTKTLEYKGNLADLGPHQFCTDNPELIALFKEILKEDFLIKHKKVAQYFQNKYVNYPLGVKDFISNINIFLTIQIGIDVILSRFKFLFKTTEDYSFKRWVETRFGKKLFNIYFGPYTKKVWGVDPENLDPKTASSRIGFNSIFDLIIKTFRFYFLKFNDFKRSHSPLKNYFYYPKLGIETLIKKMFAECVSNGVEIKTNFKVSDVSIEKNVLKSINSETGEIVSGFDLCISTLPITDMLKILHYETSLLPIRFRSMIIILLKVNKKINNPFSWIYYPDTNICFQRISDFFHFDENMVAKDCSCICAEISCFKEDEIFKMQDKDIIKKVRDDLVKCKFIDNEITIEGIVQREEYAYPVQIDGYMEIIDKILESLKIYPNLVMTGRQGLYKYCDMNECMEMIIDLVSQVEQGKFHYNLNCNFKGVGVE